MNHLGHNLQVDELNQKKKCETREKRIFFSFFFLKMSESVILAGTDRQNPRSFSRPRMTKQITPLESSREI